MRPVLCVVFVTIVRVAAGTTPTSERRGDGFSDTSEPGIHPETEVHDLEYEQFVYSPHIVINPPRFSSSGVARACCNCSAIRDIVSAETARLEAAYRRLRDETRGQLEQLQAAMSGLAQILRNAPDAVTSSPENQTPTTASTTIPTSSSSTPTVLQSHKPETTVGLPEGYTTSAATTTATTEANSTPPPTPPPQTTSQPVPVTKTASPPSTIQFTTVPQTPKPETTIGLPVTIHKDCSNALAMGVTNSGVYQLRPEDDGAEMEVYCDMDTDGGGWTVFQRRLDGSVDFYRDFQAYRQGFGDPVGEFWLGNDHLHRLTAQGDYELRIDLTDFQGNSVYAVYNSFSIADLSDKYRLSLGRYSGTAGDSLTSHNRKQFTTKDQDNDEYLTGNCALIYRGAWWYEKCHKSNLNGNYLGGSTNRYAEGVVWRRWKGYNYSLKTSEMKFRKKT